MKVWFVCWLSLTSKPLLQDEARRANGDVLLLLGNHELMNLQVGGCWRPGLCGSVSGRAQLLMPSPAGPEQQ